MRPLSSRAAMQPASDSFPTEATSKLPAVSNAKPSGPPNSTSAKISGGPSWPSANGNAMILRSRVDATNRTSDRSSKPIPLGKPWHRTQELCLARSGMDTPNPTVVETDLARRVGAVDESVGAEAKIIRRNRVLRQPLDRSVRMKDLYSTRRRPTRFAWTMTAVLSDIERSVSAFDASVWSTSDCGQNVGPDICQREHDAEIQRDDDEFAAASHDGSFEEAKSVSDLSDVEHGSTIEHMARPVPLPARPRQGSWRSP